jgi:hypothetical protein
MNVIVTNTVNELRLKKSNAKCGDHYSELGLTLVYIYIYLCIFLIAVPGVGTWYYKNHRGRRNTFLHNSVVNRRTPKFHSIILLIFIQISMKTVWKQQY